MMVDIENPPSPGRGLADSDDEGGEGGPRGRLVLSHEMAGWKEICEDLDIPSETEKYCDYVLVFDEIVEEEMNEAKNRTGCCAGCCQESYKELEECMKEQKEFRASLRREGLELTKEMGVDKKHRYLLIHTPFWRLCVEAENVGLKMPLAECPVFDDAEICRCCVEAIDNCLKTDDEVDYIGAPFHVEKLGLYKDGDNADKFFRPALRSLLTYMILINVNRSDKVHEKMTLEQAQRTDVIRSKGLLYMLHNGYCDGAFPMHDEAGLNDPGIKRILATKWSKHEQPGNKEALEMVTGSGGDASGDGRYQGRTSASASASSEDPRNELDRTWAKSCRFQPLWKIRNYFGEKIALYFAWSGTLIMSLWIPMLFGLIVFIYGLYASVMHHEHGLNAIAAQNASIVERAKSIAGDTMNIIKESFDNVLTPYYAMVIAIWGTVFLEVWKRKQSTLAYEWDVSSFESSEPDRPQFVGTDEKPDPVIPGLIIKETRVLTKLCKYAVSISMLLFMSVIVIIAVMAIIVYRLIMKIDYCGTMTPVGCFLSTTVVSSILNAVAILILGEIYNRLAVKLTDWENHRTQTQYNDMLIMKLFAFQFVNTYTSLFYIAFFRGRPFENGIFNLGSKYNESFGVNGVTYMPMLSFQVLILMLAKPIPKFLVDILIPELKLFWVLKMQPCLQRCCRKADYEEMEGLQPTPEHWEIEFDKQDVGDFTLAEYMEKVIIYGMLMLFAASLSLAPLIALIILVIDIRVDAKRMLWLDRRPVAFIAEDIGMWYAILQFINIVGVVVNAFLIAFTSSWGNSYGITGQLAIVIIFEHIVFAVKFLLAAFIPDVPADISLAIRRENYQIQRLMDQDRMKRAGVPRKIAPLLVDDGEPTEAPDRSDVEGTA